jgi:hypothetical protein
MNEWEKWAAHGALLAMAGRSYDAALAFDRAFDAMSGGADFADPYDYARARGLCGDAARQCWSACLFGGGA